MKVILASGSPRRKALFKKLVKRFQAVVPRTREFSRKGKSHVQNVCLNAFRKALKVSRRHPRALAVGADTVIVFRRKLMGKPKSRKEARRMLSALSGKRHRVITGVALVMQDPKIKKLFHDSTEVWMKRMTKAGIERTVRMTNPLDKAGAYGIQDRPKIVARIQGSYFNVMGLPVERLRVELRMPRLKKALQYAKR